MDAASVDAIVTDPPYGLEFMGKEWDHGAPGIPFWSAMLRLAKPGAYLLAFGGTRTVHRMTCAIEDAGWIIRDCLVWAYASGFPKSRALLKPAWEPIVMARKPGPLRELAIDACRIGTDEITVNGFRSVPGLHDQRASSVYGVKDREPSNHFGRWPANLILTDPIFDGDTPGVVGGGESDGAVSFSRSGTGWYDRGEQPLQPGYGDSGTYSRFFLIPKADRTEREPILLPAGHDPSKRFTTHPTIKPLDLMRHLVRLVTPTGGTVLDPFLGSGTTALAAEMEGFAWVGIEREPEYVAIAEARLNGTQRGLGLPA